MAIASPTLLHDSCRKIRQGTISRFRTKLEVFRQAGDLCPTPWINTVTPSSHIRPVMFDVRASEALVKQYDAKTQVSVDGIKRSIDQHFAF